MLFKLEEILKWIGITAFEVWLHIVSVFVFSFLAVFKYEDLIQCTWYEAFIPLFICDGLCAYFVIIVYIRMYRDRSSIIRLLSSLLSVVLLFVFKVLLCQKLSKEKIITYSEVMVPLFALVVIVMFRSCHNNSWLANVFSWFWFNFCQVIMDIHGYIYEFCPGYDVFWSLYLWLIFEFIMVMHN